MQKPYIVMIYGCDYEKNGRGLGKETKARIKKALLFLSKQTTPPTAIVVATGTPKDKKYAPLSTYMALRLNNEFLRQAMRSATFKIPIVFRGEKNYRNTFEETTFAKEVTDCYECDNLVVVSSWYHLYQISLAWSILSTKNIILIASWKSIRWWRPFVEPIKTIQLLFDWKKHIQKKKKVTSPF